MKKILFLSLMLSAAVAASAQMKVAPKMQLGDLKTYVSNATVTIPGQGTVNISDESTITIAEVLADGFVLNLETNKVTSDAKADNIAGQLVAAAQEMMAGISVRVATNAEGKPLRIVNYDDVQKKIDAGSDKLIDNLLQTVPQIGQMIPKEALKAQITENASEENLLKSLQSQVCPLVLNGKTLMTGAQEEYVTDQGLKMKRMFFVNGKNVTTNGSMNMSRDDLKALIIKQVEQMLPDQADMIKQNIDQVMDSGMMKFDMKETATYELADDGWVKSIKAESSYEAMGQNTQTVTTVTLK